MNQEYRVSTEKKVLYIVLALIMAAVPIFLSFATHTPATPLQLLIAVPFLFVSALFLLAAFKRKVVLDGQSIRYTGIFNQKEIALRDIKGYRVITGKNPALKIISVSESIPGISINNYTDFNLQPVLTTRFKDLDALDKEDETAALLLNEQLGSTEEEREQRLRKAKRIAIAYNIIGVVVLVAPLFSKSRLSFVPAMIYPFIGLWLMWSGKGLIKFYSNAKRSPLAFLLFGFVFPCIGIFATSMAFYNLLSPAHLWAPALLISAVLFFLLYRLGFNASVQQAGSQFFMMAIVALPFGFGSIIHLNGALDKAPQQVYTAPVLDHYVSHGKSTSYHLDLGPWGPRTEAREVQVSRSLYDEVNVGDTVTVILHEGRLGIPWYQVRPGRPAEYR